MFLSLYTDKAKGILTEQRFMKLTAALEQEQEANQKRLHDLAMMQSRADAQEKMCIRDSDGRIRPAGYALFHRQ